MVDYRSHVNEVERTRPERQMLGLGLQKIAGFSETGTGPQQIGLCRQAVEHTPVRINGQILTSVRKEMAELSLMPSHVEDAPSQSDLSGVDLWHSLDLGKVGIVVVLPTSRAITFLVDSLAECP